MKICGIYSITCTANNKIYVGSSSDIYNRWSKHRSLLNRNKHGNKNLTNSYLKYGVDSFKYEILEECNVDILIEKEQYWADYYKCLGIKLFNCGEFLYNPARGTKLTEEQKKQAGKGGLGKIPHNKGKKNPQWVNDKISKRQKEIGRKPTAENLVKLKECAKLPKTPEHKLNLSISRKTLYGVKILCIQTNEIFISLTDAAQKYDTSCQAIRQAMKRNGKCSGLNFKKLN